MRHRWLWGLAAALTYVLAAAATAKFGLLPARPLYDGLAPPPPYRWVKPPPDVADSNEQPLLARAEVEFTPEGSPYRTVGTADQQAIVVFREKGVKPRAGEKAFKVLIRPIDAAPLPQGPPPLEVVGNAYRISAVYASSNEPVELVQPVDVILRYPAFGTVVLRLDGNRWTNVKGTVTAPSLQVFTESDKLGTFAAAGVPHRTGRPWLPFAIAGGAVVAAVLGFLSTRWRKGGSGGRKSTSQRAARRRAERIQRKRKR